MLSGTNDTILEIVWNKKPGQKWRCLNPSAPKPARPTSWLLQILYLEDVGGVNLRPEPQISIRPTGEKENQGENKYILSPEQAEPHGLPPWPENPRPSG